MSSFLMHVSILRMKGFKSSFQVADQCIMFAAILRVTALNRTQTIKRSKPHLAGKEKYVSMAYFNAVYEHDENLKAKCNVARHFRYFLLFNSLCSLHAALSAIVIQCISTLSQVKVFLASHADSLVGLPNFYY